MLLTRRQILKMAGMATIAGPFNRYLQVDHASTRRLFFESSDLPRIRSNANHELLRPTFEAWRSMDPDQNRKTIDKVLRTHEFLGDLAEAMDVIFRETVLFIVTGESRHADMIRHGLDVMVQLPAWDYLLEADRHVLGLMRASKATACTLFAMEALGDRLDESTGDRLLESVAQKGCVPCALTLNQMDHPEQVVGWGVDALHKQSYHYDMSRWPTILGHNNLRAIPTMGLGLGALALEDRDDRAAGWLELAVQSARTFLGLFERDGSYFEGISYVDFAFRTMFMFLEAHYRTHGDVDWIKEANFRGITKYIVCLQNGRKKDGTPDIVNISDARNSVFPCVPSWIAKRSGDPLAQHAAAHLSSPGFYADFLLYDASLEEKPPDDTLLNKRFDLDWIVTRTGWTPDDVVVAFRSGPPMNHEHADRNSIMVKAFGERLLTDPFGASYDPNQPHWLLRKTEAHNAVLVDGRGHQYHNGEEGTNASHANASIVAYDDAGEVVSWSSDASEAYRLVLPAIGRVVRSVLFVKPSLLVLVDRLEMDVGVARLTARFHPDNRDGAAEILTDGRGGFEIRRPAGWISGSYSSEGTPTAGVGKLDLPDSHGVFPFLDVEAGSSASTTLVTAMSFQKATEMGAPRPQISRRADLWLVVQEDLVVEIEETNRIPTFRVG